MRGLYWAADRANRKGLHAGPTLFLFIFFMLEEWFGHENQLIVQYFREGSRERKIEEVWGGGGGEKRGNGG